MALEFPLQFQRQYDEPLDIDMVFYTTAERETYLSSPRRYAGQIVYDLEASGAFVINAEKTTWIDVGTDISQINEIVSGTISDWTFQEGVTSEEVSGTVVKFWQDEISGQMGTGGGISTEEVNDIVSGTLTEWSFTGEENQNAFSNIGSTGQSTISATTKTDTFNINAGTGIEVTTSAKTITITNTSTGAGTTTGNEIILTSGEEYTMTHASDPNFYRILQVKEKSSVLLENVKNEDIDFETLGEYIISETIDPNLDNAKFGSSILFENNGMITVPDRDDWYTQGSNINIDCWIKLETKSQRQWLYTQWEDTNGAQVSLVFDPTNGMQWLHYTGSGD